MALSLELDTDFSHSDDQVTDLDISYSDELADFKLLADHDSDINTDSAKE